MSIKYKKSELLETVELLIKINNIVKNQRSEEMTAVFAECQDKAIMLGNYIEESQILEKKAVELLEEYCESLYIISNAMISNTFDLTAFQKVEKLLNQLKKMIIQEVPNDKKEIVFLPYKASMWDSLESIWRAASQDEECITHVIPIPYFDRAADGSLAQMHYEGNEFPADVPITDWKKYDIKKCKPDIAYVHNPYDGQNLVTCIHPLFFAQELKKSVKTLVYVPYFVAVNDVVEEHFCTTPVVALADIVVVQSEKVRQNYIKKIREYEYKNECDGAFGDIDRKVLALGSPKYDKIMFVSDECFSVPEEWKKYLFDEKGKKKKVILYNTSLSNLLQYGEEMLDKLEDTLKTFSKRKETALIWRPHPLYMQTIQAMCPGLEERYTKIIEEYRQNAGGILDTSGDLDRAIWMSDAYYGDGGSVWEVYSKTQKYMLRQQTKRRNMLLNHNFFFSCICTVCGQHYAFSASHNGLYSINKQDNAMFIACVPEEKKWIKNLYIQILGKEGKLYLVPGRGNAVATYNIKENRFYKIDIIIPDNWNEKNIKFSGGVIKGDYLFLLPECYPYIVRVNILNKSCKYYELKEGQYTFKKGFCVEKENVYLPSVNGKCILKFNMDTGVIKKIDVDACDEGVWSIFAWKNKKYMVSHPDSKVICWDEESNTFQTLENKIQGYESNGYGSSVIFSFGNALDILPIKGNVVLRVRAEEGCVDEEKKVNWTYQEGKAIAYMCQDEGKIYGYVFDEKKGIFNDTEASYMIIDTTNSQVDRVRYRIENPQDFLYATEETCLYEKYGVGLDDYIQLVSKYESKKIDVPMASCGAKIHEVVKNAGN